MASVVAGRCVKVNESAFGINYGDILCNLIRFDIRENGTLGNMTRFFFLEEVFWGKVFRGLIKKRTTF